MIVQPQSVRGSQANSAVTVGLIGVGGRGTYDAGVFVKDPRSRSALKNATSATGCQLARHKHYAKPDAFNATSTSRVAVLRLSV